MEIDILPFGKSGFEEDITAKEVKGALDASCLLHLWTRILIVKRS